MGAAEKRLRRRGCKRVQRMGYKEGVQRRDTEMVVHSGVREGVRGRVCRQWVQRMQLRAGAQAKNVSKERGPLLLRTRRSLCRKSCNFQETSN